MNHLLPIPQRAIITGASSGFGVRFATTLAPKCNEMILIARREEALQEVERELQEINPSLKVIIIPCDLSDANQRTELLAKLSDLTSLSTLLINNAGLGDYGAFENSSWEKINQMIQVNITALTHLSYGMIPKLKQTGGGIINISSLAADLFIPDFAVYAASKAYVTSFSEALRVELNAANLSVTAVCPGPVATGFGKVARREGFTGNMTPGRDYFDTPVDVVINDAIKGFQKRKALVYPNLKIRIISLFLKWLPKCILRRIMSTRPRQVKPTH